MLISRRGIKAFDQKLHNFQCFFLFCERCNQAMIARLFDILNPFLYFLSQIIICSSNERFQKIYVSQECWENGDGWRIYHMHSFFPSQFQELNGMHKIFLPKNECVQALLKLIEKLGKTMCMQLLVSCYC